MKSIFESFADHLQIIGRSIHDNSMRQKWWEGSQGAAGNAKEEWPIKATRLALMHSELSECLEGIRKPHADEHCPDFSNELIELADCVIRILDYCTHYELPLARAIEAKIEANGCRPFKHGKDF